MSLDADDEILQDFLVEAGEILEQLNEQLVDLEQRPDDYDLLNAVFRGFHTIKGGAGFLAINSLVEVCHAAEDVFNVLRQGQRSVDAALMDAVLQVLDVVNAMFEQVKGGELPPPAEGGLLERLHRFAQPAGEDEQEQVQEATPGEAIESVEEKVQAAIEEIMPEEPAAVEQPAAAAGTDEISEEEFEALLDELHGKGKHGGVPAQAEAETVPVASEKASDDEISEEEFEALLDQLHGKGKFGGVPDTATPEVTPKPPQQAPSPPAAPIPAKAAAAQPQKKEEKKPAATPKAEPDAGKAAASKAAPAPAAAAAAETTVRVDTSRLDEIMNMVGELVLVRNRLDTLKSSLNNEDIATVIDNLNVVTADLQLAVMKTRMQPIKKVFGRFPRVVRDLARSLNKEIELEMYGEETDLDKNLVEALADPLVHLVRNAVDHGIEMPEERLRAGKPSKGRVVLSASQEGDHILLSIADDGKGMDPEVLRRKAVEKGIHDADTAARLDNRDCYNLIFHPGFSTKTEISDISGRGVGMDVVKTRIAQMNGAVDVDSEFGKGTTITVKLPLTLAILPTLMVVLGSQPFALPLASVVEIFNLDKSRTNVVDGQLTVRVRDRALPLFYLRKWLVKNSAGLEDKDGGHVVITNVGGTHVGLVVDHLIGQEEVVIKPLGALLQGIQGMAGATITGDGKIALILDVPGLMRQYARKYR